MTPPASNPRLFPEPVPGGSLIGSVNSRFAATFTLYQSHNPSENGQIPDVPSYETFNSDYQPDPSQSDSRDDKDVKNMIQNLSREKIEALVTQAWIRNIPNQSEDKLRELVAGAVKKGILTPDDIQISCVDSFTCLPTQVFLSENILTADSIANSLVSSAEDKNHIPYRSQFSTHSSCSLSPAVVEYRPRNAFSIHPETSRRFPYEVHSFKIHRKTPLSFLDEVL